MPQAWLGTVVPKRHAKRAVTRSLLKRQMRAALLRRDAPGQLPLRAGLWVAEIVYFPLETDLLRAARAAGHTKYSLRRLVRLAQVAGIPRQARHVPHRPG